MNRLIIIGNLTRDPESKDVGDKRVCNFNVAVNRRKRDENGNNVADFFRVSAWGKTGENCQKYLSKGKKVAVVGQVSVHAYSKQDGTPAGSLEVFAEDVEFLSANGGGETAQVAPEQAEPAVQPDLTPVDVGDELPFESGLAYP